MKKITVISDVHGRDDWKKIVNKEQNSDLFIWIGDYFDSFDIKGDKQINNFLDIIEFKKNNLNKVILLIGNHDCHYLKGWEDEYYSGFQNTMQHQIRSVLEENLIYLQMCYKQGKYLFSHAGITKTWCRNNKIKLKNIVKQVNDLFVFKSNSFKFTIGKNFSQTGDDICQTPIWVRPQSLMIDRIEDVIHVVGHTQLHNIQITDNIILTDVLGEYLTIIKGKAIINKL